METNDKFVKIEALQQLAKEALKNADTATATNYLNEMDELQTAVENGELDTAIETAMSKKSVTPA